MKSRVRSPEVPPSVLKAGTVAEGGPSPIARLPEIHPVWLQHQLGQLSDPELTFPGPVIRAGPVLTRYFYVDSEMYYV